MYTAALSAFRDVAWDSRDVYDKEDPVSNWGSITQEYIPKELRK